MKKFLVIYHAPMEFMAQMNEATPEQQAKGLEAWMNWAKNCGDKLVEMGAPLTNGVEISSNGHSKNSTKNVAGYSILQADKIEEVKSLLLTHPHLKSHEKCTIEVHEMMPIHGM